MADQRPGRRLLTALLLGAAAPALVVGGLFLAGDGLGSTTSPPDPGSTVAPPPAIRVAGPVAPASASPSASPSERSGATRRDIGVRPELVVVPRLGVAVPVVPIRTVDGVLTPPPDPQQVGWWSGGALAGAAGGAAVLTGHTVHTGGGAFDDLETLARGDRMTVRSGDRSVGFRVTTVEVLGRDELARRSVDLFGRTGPPRLVLVTCEDWDGTAYRSNVVVTAERVG